MREWIPWRAHYLKELLDMEGLPQDSCACGSKDDLLMCSDCFVQDPTCRECCLKSHQHLPFHRVRHWNGQFFTSSSLYAEGYILYLGHGGKPCPHNPGTTIPAEDSFVENLNLLQEEDMRTEEVVDEVEEEIEVDESWGDETVPQSKLVVVHTTGVFQHSVRWCYCPGCPRRHLQLLRARLYPASMKRPKTVFTFDVLDHSTADAMECKTPAQSFFRKLRRLTNNAFPQRVPVSNHFVIMPSCFLIHETVLCRTVIENFSGCLDSGVIYIPGSDSDLVMRQIGLQEMGNWLSFVPHVHSQASIYLMIGQMIQIGQSLS